MWLLLKSKPYLGWGTTWCNPKPYKQWALPYTMNPKWGGALPAGAGAQRAGSGVGAGGCEHAACCIRS